MDVIYSLSICDSIAVEVIDIFFSYYGMRYIDCAMVTNIVVYFFNVYTLFPQPTNNFSIRSFT